MTRHRLKNAEVTPAITAAAKLALTELYPKGFGAEKPLEIDGKHYVAVLEEHYHEPGGPLKPWGKHRGVTIYRVEDPA